MSSFTPYIEPVLADPTQAALSTRGLTKRFGNQLAVNNLDLDIPHGSFYGIVGPNGAGKTTAITMWTGLLRPTKGDAYVNGHSVWGGDMIAAKQSFGLLADGLAIFDRLTGAEYLHYLGALRRMNAEDVKVRSHELLQSLDLPLKGKKVISQYSAGMTKKILLAGALLHNPEVLILDEPFEAVDPVSARTIKQILRAYQNSGGTVIISSHVMELVEGLCDHVAVVAHGQVLTAGHIDQVRQGRTLDDIFVSLVGGTDLGDGSFSWLRAARVHEQPSQVAAPNDAAQPGQVASTLPDHPGAHAAAPQDTPSGDHQGAAQ